MKPLLDSCYDLLFRFDSINETKLSLRLKHCFSNSNLWPKRSKAFLKSTITTPFYLPSFIAFSPFSVINVDALSVE